MKLIIDIDENVFTRLFDNGTEDYAIVNDDLFAIAKSIRNGTPIPNATNGDVIKAIFPNASFHYHKASDIVDDYVSVCINDCDTQQDYSMAWWDAPYQKGGKE